MRFLIGWELGSERGHAALIAPVADALRRRGHEVTVALKDRGAWPAGASDIGLLQAPTWPPPPPPSAEPSSETLGDDLSSVGLFREGDLLTRARAWRTLIEDCRAEVVLAETAPTLLLAARTRCRAIAFGSAYSLPPAGHPLPVVLDPARPAPAASARREAALLAACDAVDRTLGGPGLARYSDLFDCPAWVCNLPELDPYAALRRVPAAGPLAVPAFAGDLARPALPLGERVFVYAKPFPVLPTLLDTLVPRCRHVELYISNAPAEVHNPWQQLTLHRQPIDLGTRLREFSAVVHFGGLNLAAEALFAGVPQLILPLHLEQSATGQAVQRLGTGHALLHIPREPGQEPERQRLVAEVVGRIFADQALAGRARAVAAALGSRQKPSLDGLISLCEAVAAG